MSRDKRQAYGEGSIYQRCDHPTCPPTEPGPPDSNGKPTKVRPVHTCRGRWCTTIEAGWNAQGKRRRVTLTGKTEAEVRRKLRDRRADLRRGAQPATARDRTTVKKWAEEWLELTARTLRPKTWATNASAVKLWIVPTIGHKRLIDLTPTDVRAVSAAIRKAGRSSSTAQRAHVVLSTMLRAAQLDGHDVPAVCLAVKPPTRAAHDRAAMPVSHALAILEQASTLPHGTRWAAALLQGMRQAECLGLLWESVDLDQGLLIVSWQLQSLPWVDRKDKSKGFRIPDGYEVRHLVDAYHLVRPKSRSGWRVIPLVPWLTDALKAWKLIAPENPHGLVWPTTTGRPANPKVDAEEWQALQCTAGIVRWKADEAAGSTSPAGIGHDAGRWYVLHEARHTTATLLMEAGVSEAVIIAIMGHSSIVSTQAYLHTSQEAAREAMGRVATRLQLDS